MWASDLEAESRRVAGQAQQSRRVVLEAAVVQDRQAPGGEVVERAVHGDQLTGLRAGESEGDRVHGEVAAGQVVVDSRGLDIRQRTGMGVALGARARKVVAHPVTDNPQRAEPRLGALGHADRARQVERVAVDREVNIQKPASEHDVTKRSAHEIDAAAA